MHTSIVDIGNAQILPRSNYAQVLEQIIAEGNCPFCEEHIHRFHTKPIISCSEYWLVTENAWPYNGTTGHYLFISRLHVERLEDLPTPSRLDLFNQYERLVKDAGIVGSTLLCRSGKTSYTGASVAHLHAQVIVGHERTDGCEKILALVGFQAST